MLQQTEARCVAGLVFATVDAMDAAGFGALFTPGAHIGRRRTARLLPEYRLHIGLAPLFAPG